ncbi:nucleoside recognition domain-containing protein [Rubrobacter taiwanensis]|uniref:nucleoside recognition domain-containing protein n=1 Tax=Rubrobacter taiwanensis TaxID=185139 RepID=UPI001FB2664E|nr:nucleoside recognition domain-containing protein [Rubrobacter taiwanensis]
MSRVVKTLHRISWAEGLRNGLWTAWVLGKIIFPVTLAVTALQYTPAFDVLLSGLRPVMAPLGLPEEAAIPLLLGNLVNLYAAIGAMLSLELTVKQVFILAVMLSFSHMLPGEGAICRRAGGSFLLITALRLGLAVLSAAVINLVWRGGKERAAYSISPPAQAEPSGTGEILLHALQAAAYGVLGLAAIVVPIMLLIQILRDLRFLDWFAARMQPLMSPLGLAPRASVTMASGLIFGLAFGAGVILQQAREQRFTRREITLILVFLATCHAVVEDTLIFVPLGVDVLWLLLIRLAAAVALTALLAALWREPGKLSPPPGRRGASPETSRRQRRT